MTNDELVLLIRDGHKDLTETLWAQVKKFVYKKAYIFYSNGYGFIRCELDDLKQAGFLAMMDAIEKHDPEKGNFLIMLSFCLKTAFITTARGLTEKQQKDPVFYAADIDGEIYDEGGATLEEITPGNAPDPEQCAIENRYNNELHRILEDIMDRRLTSREKDILKRHFIQGQTLKECGQVYGMSMQAAANAKDSALRKMRRRDRRLNDYINERTPFFLGVSRNSFDRDNYSPVEKIAELRERYAKTYMGKH